MERNFTDVFESVKKVSPPELVSALNQASKNWDPKLSLFYLIQYIDDHVVLSHNDPTSVAIYARIYGCSETEV